MGSFILFIILAVALVGGAALYSTSEIFRKSMKALFKVANAFRPLLEIFKARKQYKDISLVTMKYSALLEAIHENKYSKDTVQAWAENFTVSAVNALTLQGVSAAQAKEISRSMYTLARERKDLIDIISSFRKSEDIEVRKITVIAIDTIGELYDMKSKLDRSMFKHVIVAINKCLMGLREGGYNKKTYTKIGLTLHRLRIIMKSYNSQKAGRGNLTAKQLHKRIDILISAFDKVIN
jgi:hypothetical protein